MDNHDTNDMIRIIERHNAKAIARAIGQLIKAGVRIVPSAEIERGEFTVMISHEDHQAYLSLIEDNDADFNRR